MQEGFLGTSKEDAQIEESLSTSSSSAHIPINAGGNALLHAGGDTMPVEKPLRIWQLLPCSESAGENVRLSTKRPPKSSGTKKVVTWKTVHAYA